MQRHSHNKSIRRQLKRELRGSNVFTKEERHFLRSIIDSLTLISFDLDPRKQKLHFSFTTNEEEYEVVIEKESVKLSHPFSLKMLLFLVHHMVDTIIEKQGGCYGNPDALADLVAKNMHRVTGEPFGS
jgi:hypothetical protein